MTKNIFSKVMWVGRATVFCVGLSVILAVMLRVAGAALAAVPGDPFRLGQLNTIDRISQLVGTTTSAMLRIDNNGSGAALQLLVEEGRPPLTVGAGAGTARHLSADQLDGKDSTDFLGAAQRAADSDKLDTLDSTDFVRGSGAHVFKNHRRMSDTGESGNGFLVLPGFGEVATSCREPASSRVRFTNTTDRPLDVIVEDAKANTILFRPLQPTGGVDTDFRTGTNDASIITFQVSRAGATSSNKVATITIGLVNSPGGTATCLFSGQAVIQDTAID